jgi:FdhD protein
MKYQKVLSKYLEQSMQPIKLSRIESGAISEDVLDCVVIEQALTVMIDKVGSFTIMATPSDIEALAVGFVFSEGIIHSIDDVIAVSTKEQLPHVVGIQVHDPTQIATKRNMIVASSCGMCGVRNIEKMLADISPCGNSLKVSSDLIIKVTENLQSMQQLFAATGGSHAAGIFNAAGQIFAFAEDIGRHNAFDKAVGKCLLERQSPAGCGAVISGRVSLEIVTKAAKAGIEIIVAVSAPSSFAIEVAEKWNITLCGFVRPERTNVYTHPTRIHNLRKMIS